MTLRLSYVCAQPETLLLTKVKARIFKCILNVHKLCNTKRGVKIINICKIYTHFSQLFIPTEVLGMDNRGEALQAIYIGFTIACFLLNTSRVLKAIELCKECLFILETKAGRKDTKSAESLCKAIYLEMAKAYGFINDHKNAIKYAGKNSSHFPRMW